MKEKTQDELREEMRKHTQILLRLIEECLKYNHMAGDCLVIKAVEKVLEMFWTNVLYGD